MKRPLVEKGSSDIANRPLGIALIALFWLFIGGALVFSGLQLAFDSVMPEANEFSLPFGLLVFVIGAFCCSAASGLWMFAGWGRTLILTLCYLAIPLGLLSMVPPLAGEQATLENTMTQMVSIGLNVWMLWFLSQRNIRSLFDVQLKKGA